MDKIRPRKLIETEGKRAVKTLRGREIATASMSGTRKEGTKKSQGGSTALRKRLFTLKEAAEYLGRSEWSMRELIWAGSIVVVRVEGGRKIFLDIEDLNEFINNNKSIYL